MQTRKQQAIVFSAPKPWRTCSDSNGLVSSTDGAKDRRKQTTGQRSLKTSGGHKLNSQMFILCYLSPEGSSERISPPLESDPPSKQYFERHRCLCRTSKRLGVFGESKVINCCEVVEKEEHLDQIRNCTMFSNNFRL